MTGRLPDINDTNRDRFSNPVEATRDYFKFRGSDVDVRPIAGESVHDYRERIGAKITAWEEINMGAHVYNGRKMWYTHRLPQCWMCDGISMIRTIFDTVWALTQALPNEGRNHVYKWNGKQLQLTVLQGEG